MHFFCVCVCFLIIICFGILVVTAEIGKVQLSLLLFKFSELIVLLPLPSIIVTTPDAFKNMMVEQSLNYSKKLNSKDFVGDLMCSFFLH